MRKRLKRLLIVLGIIAVIWTPLFTTDAIRASHNEKPVFCYKFTAYRDGGSELYIGLFYSVYHVKSLDGINTEAIDYGYHVTSWFVSLSELKDRVVNS